MKCPFCAEEIRDQAILCRFCGARIEGDRWMPPAPPAAVPERPKGSFTIKSAGWLFALSAVLVLWSVTTPVPLAHAMRGGVIAVAYNLVFAALFAIIGVGLIAAQPWGYAAVMAGTVLYSLDKLLFIFDTQARTAYLASSEVVAAAAPMIDTTMLDQVTLLIAWTSLLCWWGFALYIHLRRGYFRRRAQVPVARPASGPL